MLYLSLNGILHFQQNLVIVSLIGKLTDFPIYWTFCYEIRVFGEMYLWKLLLAEIAYHLALNSRKPVVASLRWRHNDHAGVSNHQPHGCLLNRLFRRRWKKTSKLRVTGLCAGNSPGPVNSPHKLPVTRKMFPFDDVIMYICVFERDHHWFG